MFFSVHVAQRVGMRRGFTLIELLVVIAIIGILSSVVLASLGSARRKGRDARRIADMKQVQVALEMWHDANGNEYPDTICSTVVSGVCTAGTLMPTYIATTPNDPQASGTTWTYTYNNITNAGAACAVATGNCNSYILGATLEDGSHSALANDYDTTVDGTSCTDPIFCIRL